MVGRIVYKQWTRYDRNQAPFYSGISQIEQQANVRTLRNLPFSLGSFRTAASPGFPAGVWAVGPTNSRRSGTCRKTRLLSWSSSLSQFIFFFCIYKQSSAQHNTTQRNYANCPSGLIVLILFIFFFEVRQNLSGIQRYHEKSHHAAKLSTPAHCWVKRCVCDNAPRTDGPFAICAFSAWNFAGSTGERTRQRYPAIAGLTDSCPSRPKVNSGTSLLPSHGHNSAP